MKRVLSVTLAAALLPLLAAGECRADEVPVSGEIVGLQVVDPGKLTITPSGMVILQGLVTDELLSGDLAGTMRVTSTLIVDPTTGEGILFGMIDWQDPDSDGGLRGPFFGKVSGAFAPGLGRFDGQWWLRGYGSHQGETARIDNHGPFTPPPFQVYEGVIRVPHTP